MKKINIIIVENDTDEQFFMQEGFDSTGLFTITGFAQSGEELFELLENKEQELPDIILSDLNMPGKNGYDILSEAKNYSTLSHIPIIITSTSSIKTVVDKCKALGAHAFIMKPETFNEYHDFAKKLYELVIKHFSMEE